MQIYKANGTVTDVTIRLVGYTEETDREAQAQIAIVFLAPREIYFAALGSDSLFHTEPPHPTSKEKRK